MGAGHDAARPVRRNHRYHDGSCGTPRRVAGQEMTNSDRDTEVNQVATVKRIAGSEYLVIMTGTELDLIRCALGEAERVSRFGMKVLDQGDHGQNGSPKNSRLRQK